MTAPASGPARPGPIDGPVECPHCTRAALAPAGDAHENTDGDTVETWKCPACGYTEGRATAEQHAANTERRARAGGARTPHSHAELLAREGLGDEVTRDG